MRPMRYFALLLAIPSILVGARTHETNPMTSPEDFREGQRLYRIHCGNCHGMQGTTGRGARLARKSYHHGNTDAELFDIVEGGISGTGMPGLWLEEENIWRILLVVRTLAETASAGCDPGNGEAAAGKQVFAQKGACLACHTVGNTGGRLGPDMSFAGELYTNQQLRQALLDPARDIATRYRTVRVVTADGERVEGAWMNETSYRIHLMDRSENIRSFRKADLSSLEMPPDSLMPAYGELLSAGEIEDLLAYLCTLRAPAKEAAQ